MNEILESDRAGLEFRSSLIRRHIQRKIETIELQEASSPIRNAGFNPADLVFR